MAMAEYVRLAPLAAGVVDEYNLGPEDEMVMGEGDLAFLEHLIHEVAHAASLGILPFEKGTDDVVGKILREQDDQGIDEETRVWAIEWFCWMTLGLDATFEWAALVEAAEIQGCDETVIEALVDPENPASDEIYTLHEKVLVEVRRLTAEEASVRGATA